MFLLDAFSRKANARSESRSIFGDLIKTLRHLKHARFFVIVILLLGLASTVPTEFFVELSAVSARLGATTSLPADAWNAAIQNTEPTHPNIKPAQLPEPFIQDVVLLPEDVLLLVRLPGRDSRPFPPKENLTCLFHNMSTPVTGLDYLRGRAMIRCRMPEYQVSVRRVAVAEILPDSKGAAVVVKLPHGKAPAPVKRWGSLVFELWATEKDVVLFAKGINKKQGRNFSPSELTCVYSNGIAETKVTVSAQEVFRCEHPTAETRKSLAGGTVTLKWRRKLMPTVAYYEVSSTDGDPASAGARPTSICSCTMVYNSAKFLREWGLFHAHVGVEKFIIYDNNSEDDVEGAVSWLNDRQVEVSRYAWPWPKTQEAGFSHCAASTRHVCEWVLFTDVDEFLFPAGHLPPSGRAGPLRDLIAAAEQPPGGVGSQPPRPARSPRHHHDHPMSIGQISFSCRDFGPSGLTQHPTAGLTQGYTCRNLQEQRHKSAVKLAAVSDDLVNVVHHFHLCPGFRTWKVKPSTAAINHYKFQAWPEFRQKFRRRVSAYVADWTEARNLESRDRTPGLGYREAKPPDWETSFCEVTDTALRDYSRHVFTVNASAGVSTLAWQL